MVGIVYLSSDGRFTLNETEHGFSAWLNGKNVSVGIKKETVFRVAKKTNIKIILDEIQMGGGNDIARRLRERLKEEEMRFVEEDGMEFFQSFNDGIKIEEKEGIKIPNLGLGRDSLNFNEEEKIKDRNFYQCYSSKEYSNNSYYNRRIMIIFMYYLSSEEYLFKYLYNNLINKIDLDIGEEFNNENVEKFLRSGKLIIEYIERFEEKFIGELNYYNSEKEEIHNEYFDGHLEGEKRGFSYSNIDGHIRLGDRFRERFTKVYNYKFIKDLYYSIKIIYEDVFVYEKSIKDSLTNSGKEIVKEGTKQNFMKMGEMIRIFSQIIIQNYEYTQHLINIYLHGENQYDTIKNDGRSFNKFLTKEITNFFLKRSVEENKSSFGGKKGTFLKSLFNKEESLRKKEIEKSNNNDYLAKINGGNIEEKLKNLNFYFKLGIFNRFSTIKEYLKRPSKKLYRELFDKGDIEIGEEILFGGKNKEEFLFSFQLTYNKTGIVPNLSKLGITGKKIDYWKKKEFFRMIKVNSGESGIKKDQDYLKNNNMIGIELEIKCTDLVKGVVEYIPLSINSSKKNSLSYGEAEYLKDFFENEILKTIKIFIDDRLGRGVFEKISLRSLNF